MKLVVDQNAAAKNSASFNTIAEAFEKAAKLEGKVTIYIKKGIYREKLVLERPSTELIGESAQDTVIVYGDYAKMIMPDQTVAGTFRTATLRTDADNITLKNLTIQNDAGPGNKVGQAVALYAEGDNLRIINCRLIANQDTLFTAPLPPKNIQGNLNGLGPKAQAERKNGRQLYKNCYIEGDVDFIFGGATAYFDRCTIFSHNRETEIPDDNLKGYIAAPCTPQGQKYGYVFYKCNLISDCPPESVYLGRPWRDYAKAVFIKCRMGEHIKSEGFHDWDKPHAHSTTFFAEYGSICQNPISRVDWAHTLTKKELKEYKKSKILSKESLNINR